MAMSTFTKRCLLSALVYICVSSSKFGSAFDYYPHLGAAGVVAEEYLPQAESEGDQFLPQAGLVGTTPAIIFNKALGCLADQHIYSQCDPAHRLTQEGVLNVAPEYTDEYCNGPCVSETHHALACIDEIFGHFLFYNRASIRDIRDTIEGGCSRGPLRGNFNVQQHLQDDYAGANKVLNPVLLPAFLLMVGWQLIF